MTTLKTRILILFFICASPLAAKDKDKDSEISFKSTEVASGIYMLEGVGGFTGGNLGVLTGEDGVVLIDDGMQALFEKTSAAIREQVGADVDFVVNTHAHGDHIGGNQGLSKSGATIIGHNKLRQRLVKDGISGPDGKMPATKHWLPEVTYSEAMSLHLNGQEIHVFHVANAHTDGDSIVHFPSADVIHSGDILFNGMFPYVDHGSGGSVDGFLDALRRILQLAGEQTKIIAGHGPLANKGDVQAAHDMLADSRDRIASLINDGKTADEILSLNPLDDYTKAWSWGFVTTEVMTKSLIKDIQNKNS